MFAQALEVFERLAASEVVVRQREDVVRLEVGQVPFEHLDVLVNRLRELELGDHQMKHPQATVAEHPCALGQFIVDGQVGQQGSFGGFEGFVGQSLLEFTLTPLLFLLTVFLLAALGFFPFLSLHLKCSFWCGVFGGCKRKITPKTVISSFC